LKQEAFLDSSTKKMNFGKMITFSIGGSTKRNDPDNRQSDKAIQENLARYNNDTKQVFGINQPLNNPVLRNANALIQDPTHLAAVRTYSAAQDMQGELDKQNSLRQAERFLWDAVVTARQAQYIRLGREMDDFLTQHILFWINATNIFKEMEATTAELAAK
jgi:hypothetical protein